MQLFGKHTFVKAGFSWEGNIQYMTKNVAPKGKADAVFLTIPEVNREATLKARRNHSIDDQKAKTVRALELYTTGRGYELFTSGEVPLA